MKKLLIFVLMFLCAFTILKSIQGTDFNFYDYVKNVSLEMEDLSPPGLPNFNTDTRLNKLNELSGYYFNWESTREFIQNNNLETCPRGHSDDNSYWEFKYNDKCYIIWVYTTNDEREYIDKLERSYFYTSNDYEEFPQELKDLCSFGTVFDSLDSTAKLFIQFEHFGDMVINFFVFLYDLLIYLVDLLMYLLEIIFIIGGGLLV